jgi:hypothetical protein
VALGPASGSAFRNARSVEAGSVLCYWAKRELGIGTAELARRLKIAQPTVTQSVAREGKGGC